MQRGDGLVADACCLLLTLLLKLLALELGLTERVVLVRVMLHDAPSSKTQLVQPYRGVRPKSEPQRT